MIEHFRKIMLIGIVFASAMMLGACGGGDSAPVSVPDVIVMMKDIRKGENAAGAAIQPLFEAGITLLEIRCAQLSPAPGIVAPGNQYVLLVDVSAADAIKAKALGFQIFGPDEQSRRFVDVCY